MGNFHIEAYSPLQINKFWNIGGSKQYVHWKEKIPLSKSSSLFFTEHNLQLKYGALTPKHGYNDLLIDVIIFTKLIRNKTNPMTRGKPFTMQPHVWGSNSWNVYLALQK